MKKVSQGISIISLLTSLMIFFLLSIEQKIMM